MTDPSPRQRIDKWLWHARFFKTRGMATDLVASGRVRVNGERIAKAAYGIQTGDTLTFPQARRIRVVAVKSLSKRRGPAPEAQALYDDMTPVEESAPSNPRFEGKGRPTKKDRRDGDLTRKGALE